MSATRTDTEMVRRVILRMKTDRFINDDTLEHGEGVQLSDILRMCDEIDRLRAERAP